MSDGDMTGDMTAAYWRERYDIERGEVEVLKNCMKGKLASLEATIARISAEWQAARDELDEARAAMAWMESECSSAYRKTGGGWRVSDGEIGGGGVYDADTITESIAKGILAWKAQQPGKQPDGKQQDGEGVEA
jgi:hypothetical protein